jgi:peptidyl-prolyl cis-trans isomerase D
MFRGLMKSEAMRRRVSWTIAAVLILPFLIYFHAGLQGSAKGPGGSAGRLFGKDIPWDAFEAQRAWVHRQWANQLGGNVPEQLEPMVTQQAWDRLMLLEQARQRKLTISDEALAAFIRQQTVFQQEGRFVSVHYKRVVQAVGLQPGEFEHRVREDLLIDKLVSGIKAATAVSDDEARDAYQEANEQLRATLVIFDPADVAKAAAAEITPERIEADYAARPELVREPEQISAEYAGLTREAIAQQVSPTEEELRAHYVSHEAEFRKDDGVVPTFEAVQEDIRRQVQEPQARKAFVALTLDLEEDVKTQRAFDDIVAARLLARQALGPMAVDAIVSAGWPQAVRDALPELTAGQMSEVLETPEGVYIARVTARQPSKIPPLEQVREHIAQRLKTEAGVRLAREAAEAWRAQITAQQHDGVRFEEASLRTLAPHARRYAATFTRTSVIEPLGAVGAVNQAAFAAALGALTEVLDANGRFVIARPEERLPADEGAFTAEIERWRQEKLTKKQSEEFERWFTQIRAKANLKSFVSLVPGA